MAGRNDLASGLSPADIQSKGFEIKKGRPGRPFPYASLVYLAGAAGAAVQLQRVPAGVGGRVEHLQEHVRSNGSHSRAPRPGQHQLCCSGLAVRRVMPSSCSVKEVERTRVPDMPPSSGRIGVRFSQVPQNRRWRVHRGAIQLVYSAGSWVPSQLHGARIQRDIIHFRYMEDSASA